ncbi:MAG: efflux RND transporter permease subunit, partial [Acidobacteriota bacterium]
MSLPHFFIDRPIFATVMSTAIVLVGALAYGTLPVAQFPDVAPPTVVVAASYPGASPDVIARTVSTPLEQQINGVEGMIYMSSQSTNDGAMTITVSFELGTDLDTAQVQVQNRVATALPALPEDVRRIGVVTQKQSPDLLLVGHLVSPDHRYNRLYISNYAFLQVRDALARIEGVGDVAIFGAREYSMRVWLDPQRLAALDLTSSDVLAALREQNLQVAAGVIGQQPAPTDSAFQLSVGAQGRLEEPEEFGRIVVRTTEDGSVVRVEDVARVELGALDYSLNSYLDGEEAVAIAVRQRPGSNALATARAVEAELGRLAESFPPGLEHRIVYNPTTFIQQSIDEVIRTIFEAVILVVIVVLVFLQSFRATFIPLAAIPVSLIGTFAVMAGFGFSLNNLTLFGLV